MEVAHDTKRLAAWESMLRTVGSLIQTFEQELQDGEGVPLNWYDVLVQLNVAPGHRLRMQALAERVVLSRSGLTRLVDRMESAGLVRREPSGEDRRGHYTVLTEEGKRVFGRLRPLHHRGIQEHFARYVDDADAEAMLNALAKVREGNGLPQIGTGA